MSAQARLRINGGTRVECLRRTSSDEPHDIPKTGTVAVTGPGCAHEFDAKILRAVVGSVLRDERRRAGVSQDKLSALAAVDRTTPSGYENATRLPSLPMLFRLCIALGVDPAYIVVQSYKAYCRVSGIPIPHATSLQLAAYEEIEKAHDLKAALISKPVKPVTLRYSVMRHKLRNSSLALDILEASVNGQTFTQCAKRFGVTLAWCGQLARKAAAVLIDGVNEGSIPPHDWTQNPERIAHREFWMELIRKARKTVAADFGGVPIQPFDGRGEQ